MQNFADASEPFFNFSRKIYINIFDNLCISTILIELNQNRSRIRAATLGQGNAVRERQPLNPNYFLFSIIVLLYHTPSQFTIVAFQLFPSISSTNLGMTALVQVESTIFYCK